MSKPTTKAELKRAAETGCDKLGFLLRTLTEQERQTPFDFSADPRKKEAHWARDKNPRDVLVHLYEWHRLLLDWVQANQNGEARPFLPPPYNWRTYGAMNREIWEKHQGTPLDEAQRLLAQSHREVMELLETFSDEQLFVRGVYPWTGNNTLGAYFISSTSSHYDWAMKKLKAHKKNCKEWEKADGKAGQGAEQSDKK